MFTGPRRRWKNSTASLEVVSSQEVWSSLGEILGLGNRPCSFKYQPSYPKWEQFFTLVERSRPSRSNFGQSAWEISTVSFISMLRLICRACEQKWSASSLTSSSLTRSRLSCLLKFQGFRDQSLRSVR